MIISEFSWGEECIPVYSRVSPARAFFIFILHRVIHQHRVKHRNTLR